MIVSSASRVVEVHVTFEISAQCRRNSSTLQRNPVKIEHHFIFYSIAGDLKLFDAEIDSIIFTKLASSC